MSVENPAAVLSEQVGGDHYSKLGMYQPWEVLRHWMTSEEFRGFMKGNAIVYLAREGDKGGDQDIAKAAHTLRAQLELGGMDHFAGASKMMGSCLTKPQKGARTMSIRGLILTLSCLTSLLFFAGVAAALAGADILAGGLFAFSGGAFAAMIGALGTLPWDGEE